MPRSHSFIIVAILAFTACKKDDPPASIPTPEPIYETGAFAPATIGSWWTYDQFNIAPGTGLVTSGPWHDSIYVAPDTVIDGLTYHQWKGTRFEAPFRWIFRTNGPKLVDNNNGTYFDLSVVSDTLFTSPGTEPVTSVSFVLSGIPDTLSTPSGELISECGREYVFSMIQGFPSPQYAQDRFVRSIGIGMFSTHYFSGVQVEMRLSNHFIAE